MRQLAGPAFLLALLQASCAGVQGAGRAEAGGPAAEGRKIIEARCASCHSLGAKAGHPDAPSVLALAQMGPPEGLAESLAEGIMVGHPDMPEARMSAKEIEAVIAFLKTY